MSATLLPNAEQQFIDANGKPIAGGSVYFYIPNTTTPKATWQDPAQTILNTNPVILDAAGRAIIWGFGTYRQQVFDQFNNLVWDQITEDTSGGLFGNITDNLYTAPANFTPGITTQLTISTAPGSSANMWVYFDGVFQTPDTWSVSTTTVTFGAPIPVGVQEVTIKVGSTIAIGTPGSGTVTDATVAANAAIRSTKLSFLANGANAVSRTVQSKLSDWVSVRDYGAKGDGITDDTAAINLALVDLASNGGTLFFPQGKYLVSGAGLSLNQSVITDDLLTHGCLKGAGMGATEIYYTGTGSAFTYKGAPPPYANSYCSIEDMRFLGVSQSAGTGLTVQDASFLTLRNFTIQLFGLGINGTDVLQSMFENVLLGANGGGMILGFSNFTQPNAITFLNCSIISNLNFGVNLADPTTCVFIGGSVQSNGVGGSATDRYGVGVFANISGAGEAGAAAASFFGTYFEANQGHADIWYTAGNGTDGDSSMYASACTFNRLSNASSVVNNVRADIGASNKVKVTLLGNGFNGFGSYSPSSGTPYVAVNPSGGAVYEIVDLGNLYGSNVEKPVLIGPNKTGAAMATAYCTFNGTLSSPTVAQGFNVGSITKTGTGDYTISFQTQGPNTNYPVSISANGVCFPVIFSPNSANVRIQTYNSSSVLTDFSFISMICFGNNDVT